MLTREGLCTQQRAHCCGKHDMHRQMMAYDGRMTQTIDTERASHIDVECHAALVTIQEQNIRHRAFGLYLSRVAQQIVQHVDVQLELVVDVVPVLDDVVLFGAQAQDHEHGQLVK